MTAKLTDDQVMEDLQKQAKEFKCLLAIFGYFLAFLIGESHDKSNAFLVMSLGWMMVEKKRGRRGQVALGEKYSVETMEMDRK